VIGKGGQRGATLGQHSGTVLRIARDGRSATVLGYGLRQPFIGVHPVTGLITVSDQQGHYIPTTPLHLIQERRYYGFIPLILPREQYPAAIADPLTWIPHAINASGAGQVWLTDERMGPLSGSLVHIGYFRPELFLVLLNQRASRTQAAVLSLTRDLDFAPLAGAMNPVDGQLYVTGFQIWGSTAKEISGLARVRHTGAAVVFPREIAAMQNGILLRFHGPIRPGTALEPANYSVERWNYRRTAEYGSPHFLPTGGKGQETMEVSSVYLSLDGTSVFIAIPGLKPVMQMRLGWSLATRDGASFAQNAYFTPYELTSFDPVAEGFGPLSVDLTPRARTSAESIPLDAADGKRLAELMGCVACHSTDGSTLSRVGPTWKGLFGSQRWLVDGAMRVADEEYLRESIRRPTAGIVRGFESSDAGMPSYEGVLTDQQIEALVLYLKSIE
jgi:cytochrome c2